MPNYMDDEFDKYYEMVRQFFNGDTKKATLWFHSENPMLGGLVPLEMVQTGRGEKLYKFIRNSLEENII